MQKQRWGVAAAVLLAMLTACSAPDKATTAAAPAVSASSAEVAGSQVWPAAPATELPIESASALQGEIARWVNKAHHEVRDGRAKTVVALLPARTDTAYWHEHVAGRAVIYFLRGRLRFGDGAQGAPFPSALVLWGAGPEVITALDTALPNTWRAR